MEGRHRLFGWLAAIAFGACYVTVLLGGNVMASGSGLACPSWPTCFGRQVIPPLTGAAGVESMHRVGALVLSLLVLAVTMGAILWERRRPALLRLALASGVTVVVQAVIGAVVVETGLAVGVVLLHFAVATVLFLLLLILALVANLRFLPRRWTEWALEAGTDAPVNPYRTSAPTVRSPGPVPGAGES
jgi:heme a synthase